MTCADGKCIGKLALRTRLEEASGSGHVPEGMKWVTGGWGAHLYTEPDQRETPSERSVRVIFPTAVRVDHSSRGPCHGGMGVGEVKVQI